MGLNLSVSESSMLISFTYLSFRMDITDCLYLLPKRKWIISSSI